MITVKEFDRALIQVAPAKGRRAALKPGGPRYRKLKNEALGELIDGEWIRGQAAEMGIGVRSREVARVLARLKKEAFGSGAQYRHFLRKFHYTRRDINEAVEVQLLAEKIQERIVAGIGSETGQRRAVSKFVAEYEERWESRTVCAPDYLIDRCSNGPKPG
ncbi:MAG TPA: SurA N-terminal domain-containing protein [Solirubrobacterales bacterium]|nr:SurA N-terminal domain-containing protein [Solirubrobacterales bacterium]